MTITILTADVLTPSDRKASGCSIYGGHGHTAKNRTPSDLYSVTKKVIIMTNYIAQLHNAKTDVVNSAGAYQAVIGPMLLDLQTDVDAIGAIVLESLNKDYPVLATKDNPTLKTGLNSFQNACKKCGAVFADGENGEIRFKFSTTGGKDNKSRTVAVTHWTVDQIKVESDRAAADDKLKADREKEDSDLQAEKVAEEKKNMSDFDIFLRLKAGMESQFPAADMVKVMSAGIEWYEKQSPATVDAEEEEKRTGTNG